MFAFYSWDSFEGVGSSFTEDQTPPGTWVVVRHCRLGEIYGKVRSRQVSGEPRDNKAVLKIEGGTAIVQLHQILEIVDDPQLITLLEIKNG